MTKNDNYAIKYQPDFGKKVIPPVPEGKVNRFFLVHHFCNRLDHIHLKCYKCKKKKIRMNRIEQPYFKPRIASKIKIKLNNKPVKK